MYQPTAHGIGCGVGLPCTMAFNVPVCEEKLVMIARAMGEKVESVSVREAARKAAQSVYDHTKDVKMPVSLKEMGFRHQDVPKMAEICVRFVIAVLCMLPLFVMNKRKQLSLREYRQAFLLAIFLFINATLFTIAIQYTTAVMSQILYTAAPIVVGLLGHYFFHNRLTKENIIGLCIALAGVLFLIMQSATKQEHMTFGTPFGNILILIAMLSFSGYLLYSGVLAKTQVFTSVQLTSVTFVFVALILFVINAIGFLFFKESIGVITTTGMSSMVLVGFGNAFAYLLSLIGIKRTNAFTASLFQYISPFLSGAFAIPFLHEKPTVTLFAGGLLILLGVFYATTWGSIKKNNQISK